MVVFLKSMGNKAWKDVLKGSKHLVVTSKDGNTSLKLEVEWTDDEALGSQKALNDIFNSVDKNMLRLIKTC